MPGTYCNVESGDLGPGRDAALAFQNASHCIPAHVFLARKLVGDDGGYAIRRPGVAEQLALANKLGPAFGESVGIFRYISVTIGVRRYLTWRTFTLYDPWADHLSGYQLSWTQRTQ